ncbi:unnamed protein product [Nezara viridula]|uniref:Uncharacterized protein n=1 Tax=Nezara viridula TaxID=85310 RepID=A0A9P0ED97_NEZVI|nr:unnamed protein product [Nezara viridula]
MAFLFLKNLATFAVLMLMLMIILISNVTVISPTCDIYSDGSRFFSCVNTSNTTDVNLSLIEVPQYEYSYTYVLVTSFFFLFACFLNEDFYNPFALRYIDSIEDITDYTFDDLTNEVVKLIRFKTDVLFLMRDVIKHIFDILHMIVHLILSYGFSFYCALNMGYTTEEAKYEFFPSVKKCSFDHWPFRAECKVGYGTVLKGVFVVLWMWYFVTSLIIVCCIINKIWKCYKTKKGLRYKNFTTLEDWLAFICQEKIIHLNRMSCRLHIKDFEEAARRLVLEPQVKRLGPRDLEIEIELETLLPVISSSWPSLDSQISHTE